MPQRHGRTRSYPGNVILLRRSPDGSLKRITGTVSIRSRDFALKTLEASKLSSFRHSPMVYNLLYP